MKGEVLKGKYVSSFLVSLFLCPHFFNMPTKQSIVLVPFVLSPPFSKTAANTVRANWLETDVMSVERGATLQENVGTEEAVKGTFFLHFFISIYKAFTK